MKESGPNSSGHSSGPKTLDEALKVLDDALAGGTAQFRDLVSEEFTNLRTALSSISGPELTESVRKSRRALESIGTSLHRNPWLAIGGVALGTFAIGVFLGNRSAEPELMTERESFYSRRH